jgi:hypothetical protein
MIGSIAAAMKFCRTIHIAPIKKEPTAVTLMHGGYTIP